VTIYKDLETLIDNGNLAELHPRAADEKPKRPGRPPVSLRGVILDQYDAERLTSVEAYQLLTRCIARCDRERVDLNAITVEPRDDGVVEI